MRDVVDEETLILSARSVIPEPLGPWQGNAALFGLAWAHLSSAARGEADKWHRFSCVCTGQVVDNVIDAAAGAYMKDAGGMGYSASCSPSIDPAGFAVQVDHAPTTFTLGVAVGYWVLGVWRVGSI